MTADEHPEDAIDRALSGELEPAERARLEQHLAVCAICAAQIKHAPRFQAELAAPSRAELLERRAIEGAMARLRSTGVRRRPAPLWMRSAAAGLLLVGGGVAAALLGKTDTTSPSPGPEPPPLRATQSPGRGSLPLPEVAGVGPAAPEPLPPTTDPPPAATSTVSASELFRRGGELRRDGHPVAAIAVYRRLQRSHPQTREARLSFALAGQLLLDTGRSSEALAQFDRYLAAGSEVDEEALAGRASALERLGRTTDAAAAWKTLLERRPDSVYAETARARLERLSTTR